MKWSGCITSDCAPGGQTFHLRLYVTCQPICWPGLKTGVGIEHLHVAKFESCDLYPFIGYRVWF